MSINEWAALGIGATIMVAFVVLFWRIAAHEKP